MKVLVKIREQNIYLFCWHFRYNLLHDIELFTNRSGLINEILAIAYRFYKIMNNEFYKIML